MLLVQVRGPDMEAISRCKPDIIEKLLRTLRRKASRLLPNISEAHSETPEH